MAAITWLEGDIAFLKDYQTFNDRDTRELISSGIIHERATGHPCIILKMLPGARAVVTTVSAHGSGDYNNNLAPWLAIRSCAMDRPFFRSFQGSVCSSNRFKPLQLIPGQSMPKPKTSWVNIKNVYNVPLSVIGRFTKPRYRVILKMAPDSLADLQMDIAKRCPCYSPRWQLADTQSCSDKRPMIATRELLSALPEADAVALITTKMRAASIVAPVLPQKQQAQYSGQSGRGQPITTPPVPVTQAAARPKQLSWASVASTPVANKPTSGALRRSTSRISRPRMVKATA